MASAWEFPTSLNIGGTDYEIRTDYRAVLDLLTALNDNDLTDDDKQIEAYMKSRVILEIMFPQCDDIPAEHIQEALDKVAEFIDMGITSDTKKPKVMDWEQDSKILISPINKILGYEVRNPNINTHWWTFLSAYMEIGESLFATVIHIREKLIKGKKLDKWEQEFYKDNKSLIDFKEKKTQRSEEEKSAISELFYGHKK